MSDANQGDSNVPEFTEIFDVYGNIEGAAERYALLKDVFVKQFGDPPEFYARAPGRVNLIGEHIDYEGYGVLPMAIRQDTVVAIRRGESKLIVANIDPEKYPQAEFEIDPAQEVDIEHHSWAHYFLAAYKGVFDHLGSTGAPLPAPLGLKVLVDGTVPQGAGLSSSAAIVCSCALAVLAALERTPTKAEIAEFTCKAERYVGVTSGGMDQAISIMGAPGLAKLVEFNPVRASDVHLPPDAIFVVAHSLAVSNKAETAPSRYNMRVIECRLAAALITLGLGRSKAEAMAIRGLSKVEPMIAEKYGSGEAEFLKGMEELLHDGSYTQPEVEELLGVTLEELLEGYPLLPDVLQAAAVAGGFKLRDRASHVFCEARRVHAFKAVCEDAEIEAGEKLMRLGELMDASHASCAGKYECSCDELDELVGLAKVAGALGSRLTGAGWGGCTVSLLKEESVPAFLESMKTSFFASRIAAGVIKEDELHEYLFATKPSSGAAILKLKS